MEISGNPAIVRHKKELFFDEIDFDQQVPLPLEESDLTILQLFDRVLREVTSKGFSQSTLDLCMPYICRLAQLQAITNRQAFIMAICMNFSLNMSITLRAVANMLDTTNMMLMHWMPDFHALCEKELLEEKNFRMVQKRLQERGFHKGIACLFYGSPGTGKTETVLQLAKSSGRDVMQVSMSQIRSKWVGESQKNIQEVFASYKERVRASKLCPILLFNEADAIIGNRMEVTTSSVDKMENSIQNVILQEMENLEGIMIATTNLQGSLDAAFERRFLYKVEFEKPSLQVRTQIWHSMMPDVDEATLSSIASQYDFSGGQIENIARKALVDDLLFYSSDISNKERISTFCRQEALSKNAIKGFSL